MLPCPETENSERERQTAKKKMVKFWEFEHISVDLVTIGNFGLNKLINLCVRWVKTILCKNQTATQLPSFIFFEKNTNTYTEESHAHGEEKQQHLVNWLVENDDYRCRFLSARSVWSRWIFFFFYFSSFFGGQF